MTAKEMNMSMPDGAIIDEIARIICPEAWQEGAPRNNAPYRQKVFAEARAEAMEKARQIAALASGPAELAFLRQFYDDWRTGKADSYLSYAADNFEDAGGVIFQPSRRRCPACEPRSCVEYAAAMHTCDKL